MVDPVDQGQRERYLEQLVVSLRMRGFSAERIRETLSEVEAHLDAGGEDPVETFGEPWEFAESLDSARDRPTHEKRWHSAKLAVIGFFSLLTVLLALRGIGAMLAGTPAQLGTGELVAFALALGVCVLLWRVFVAYAEGNRSLWSAVALFFAGSVTVGAVWALLAGPVLVTVPAWALLGAAVLLGVSVVLLARPDPL